MGDAEIIGERVREAERRDRELPAMPITITIRLRTGSRATCQ
jgi:hypothetical protein